MRLRDGSTVTDPRLDRLFSEDPRSKDFMVSDEPRFGTSYRRPIRVGPTLNQKNLGGCVGWSDAHLLNSSPWDGKPTGQFFKNPFAMGLYFSAQQEDEWPGGEYPGADPVGGGTSLLAAMRVLHRQGQIKGYRWLDNSTGEAAVEDAYNAVRNIGPVQVGIPFHQSMYRPKKSGRLNVDTNSGLPGYHAMAIVDAKTFKPEGEPYDRYFVLQQTWGPGWGVRYLDRPGFCYILDSDLALLLPRSVYGEGVVPIA